jgi:hypothetical protein
MSPLNIHPEEAVNTPKKKKNKNLKVMLGIAALVAVPVVGTTLAASITLNSNEAIQFGQGVVQAVACDSDGITVTPSSSFDNDATFASASFKLETVVITDIADACSGSTFTIKIYGPSSDTPVTISAGGATTTALIAGLSLTSGAWTTTKEEDSTYTAATTYTSNDSTLTFTLAATPVVAATGVSRITVETSS